MISYNTNYINIVNDYIPQVFNSKDLLKLSVEGKKNCCTDLESIEFDLQYDPSCIFTASYQNYQEQSTCTPTGSKNPEDCLPNPIASYYKNVSELYILLGGKSTNILDRVYDMTLEADITLLQEDIIAYFTANNIKAVVEVNITTNSTGYLKTEILISNLPTNVKFESFILANDETCYVNIVAVCDFGIACAVSQYELPNNAYIYSIVTDDTELILSSTVGKFATEEELQVLTDLMANLNYNIEFSFDDTNFIVSTLDNPINYIKYKVGAGEFTSFSTCITYEEELPKCVYSTKIPKGNTVNSVLVYNEDESFTSSLFVGSIDLTTDTYENDLYQSFLPSNSTITVEEDSITIEITDGTYIPYSIIVDDVVYYFACNSLEYFQNNYDSDSIEFTGNGLNLKSEYLGGYTSGVYNVKLTVETQEQIISESYCLFVDLDLKCKIAKLTDLDELREAIFLYEALNSIQDCADCECENACILYQELYNILSRNNITSENCNC